MPTECSAEHFDFGAVEGRAVEAAFDGGLVSSDAGALLLGATDRAIGLIDQVCGVLSTTSGARLDSSTRLRRWSVSGCSGSRWVTRISTTTTNCATIR